MNIIIFTVFLLTFIYLEIRVPSNKEQTEFDRSLRRLLYFLLSCASSIIVWILSVIVKYLINEHL